MVHNHEMRVRRTKIYLHSDGTNAEAHVECDQLCDVGWLVIPMTAAQMERIILRQSEWPHRESIQDILPDTDKALREVFVSGETPAMWDHLFLGSRKHWRHYAAMGYKFETDWAERMDAADKEAGREWPAATTVEGKPVEVLAPEDLR